MQKTKRVNKKVSTQRRVVLILSLFAMLFSFTAVSAVNAPEVEARSSTCTGDSSRNIDTAKSLYFVGCGWIVWDANSGDHFCEWGSSGWSCSGPRGAENNRCHSLWHTSDIELAKDRYAENCAQRWDGKSGSHQCTYFSHRNSWLCFGPSNR